MFILTIFTYFGTKNPAKKHSQQKQSPELIIVLK